MRETSCLLIHTILTTLRGHLPPLTGKKTETRSPRASQLQIQGAIPQLSDSRTFIFCTALFNCLIGLIYA